MSIGSIRSELVKVLLRQRIPIAPKRLRARRFQHQTAHSPRRPNNRLEIAQEHSDNLELNQRVGMQTDHEWSLKDHRCARLEEDLSTRAVASNSVSLDHDDYFEPPRHFAGPSHHNCAPPTRSFNYQLDYFI
jgi:hypothetical protein